MSKIEHLTKEALLELTLGGWLYIITIFTDLQKISDTKCRPIINHLRGEKNASLSFTYKRDKWQMYDFADPNYRGDVFNLYAIVNGIDDVKENFVEIMRGIYRDTFNEEPPEFGKKDSRKKSLTKGELPDGYEYFVIQSSKEKLSKASQKFLDKYELSLSTLESLNMSFLDSYTFKAKTGEIWTSHAINNDVFIAHRFDFSRKVYKPNDKEYRYHFLGDCPYDYFVGIEQLDGLMQRVELDKTIENEKIIIVLCAGGKDTMVATELGFVAISLNSETSTRIPSFIIEALERMNKRLNTPVELKIVYDLDDTGMKMANTVVNELSGRYDNVSIVELPQKLLDAGGNDLADWIGLGLDKQELIDIIGGGNYNVEAHKNSDQLKSTISPVSPGSKNHSKVNSLEEPTLSYERNDQTSSSKNKISSRFSSLMKTMKDKPEDSKENYIGEIEDIEHSECQNELPASLYNDLPKLFQDMCSPFEQYLRTMMLYSFITTIGSVLPNVLGKFRGDKLFTNLFTCIVAPPASGKSVMKWARHIIMPIEKFLDYESKSALAEYNAQQQQVLEGELKKEDAMTKPPYRLHLISTDITSSMWMLQIQDNDGYGLMFDTEMDGLINSNSSNLNSFTDKLRKIYENETLSLMRKTDRERILIEEGKMSMLLSGTPRQFFKLVPDTENGLFSRIMPIKFNGQSTWMSSYESNSIDYEEYYGEIALKISELFQTLYESDLQFRFEFTQSQLEKLDKEFEVRLKNIMDIAGVDGRATVMRLGAITLKIAMILSTIRAFENNKLIEHNFCEDIDFETALILSGFVLQNVIKILKDMNEERVENCFRGKKLDYYYALPNSFTYSQSQEIAQQENVKLRTAQKWVYDFRNKGFLINPEKGQFKKLG